MQLVAADENDRTGANRMGLIVLQHPALALEHEHFVFVRVRMPWRETTRRHFKLAHRKIRRLVVATNKPADSAALGTIHFNRCLLYFVNSFYDHRDSVRSLSEWSVILNATVADRRIIPRLAHWVEQ